jgi:hypothetical protein
MTEVVTDPSLSVAYRALERRREEVIAARDRIAAELKKLDAALEALHSLADSAPEAAAPKAAKAADSQETVLPAAQAAEPPAKAAPKPAAPKPAVAKPAAAKPAAEAKPAAAKPAAEAGRSADRKVRVIEFLLENPRQWFTSSEIALVTEGENISGTQRNAVSETLRRLLGRKAVQRDDKTRPVRYRAVSAALRELLLSE